MLDVATDLTLVPAQLGGHIEVLEIDDLRVRVEKVTDAETDARVALAQQVFELDASVVEEDLRWGARVSVALDRLVEDFALDSLAYYHRGLDGETHETRRGRPDPRRLAADRPRDPARPASTNSVPRSPCSILDRLGAGGSFTEFQALNFRAGVVEMGHDGPAHLAISQGRPMLRGLGVYHGKRGWGVSVEFDVTARAGHAVRIGQEVDGRFRFIVAEGEVVDGPHLPSEHDLRVDFGCHPGSGPTPGASPVSVTTGRSAPVSVPRSSRRSRDLMDIETVVVDLRP